MEKKRKKRVNEKWKKTMKSLPFDFLQSHHIGPLLLAIEKDFENLIDKNHLRLSHSHTIPRSNPKSASMQHIFIHKEYGLKFMHRFMSRNTPEDRDNIWKEFDNIKETFDRQIERFREFTSGEDLVYFIRYLGGKFNKPQLTKVAYIQEKEILEKRLKKIFPKLNYRLIVMRSRTELLDFFHKNKVFE